MTKGYKRIGFHHPIYEDALSDIPPRILCHKSTTRFSDFWKSHKFTGAMCDIIYKAQLSHKIKNGQWKAKQCKTNTAGAQPGFWRVGDPNDWRFWVPSVNGFQGWSTKKNWKTYRRYDALYCICYVKKIINLVNFKQRSFLVFIWKKCNCIKNILENKR